MGRRRQDAPVPAVLGDLDALVQLMVAVAPSTAHERQERFMVEGLGEAGSVVESSMDAHDLGAQLAEPFEPSAPHVEHGQRVQTRGNAVPSTPGRR